MHASSDASIATNGKIAIESADKPAHVSYIKANVLQLADYSMLSNRMNYYTQELKKKTRKEE